MSGRTMAKTATESKKDAAERRREAAERDRRAAAARRQIRTLGDPVLREKATPVTEFDERLAELADRMIKIMDDAPGIGLAAPQLGVVRRLLVYQVADAQPHALVNPEILWRSDETDVHDEGCLSVPDVVVPVERALRIRVRAQDIHGEPLDYEAEEMEARVIQHESDHLDGILILDRTTRRERVRALRELREADAAF
jgi:peptide deformylase